MSLSDTTRPLWLTIALLGAAALLVASFISLGNWQMRRLHWKTSLIEAVETRAFGAPVALPPSFDADRHEYLRAEAAGTPIEAHLRVKAVTDLGPGYWVMSPMQTERGILWINRGFVTPDRKAPEEWQPMPGSVSGLLRPSVPGGTMMERNDPAANRWVSRDTAAMSAALGLGPTLPYFVDADHIGPAQSWPRGGMTILKFRNTHLSYALTWYAMAALFAAALIWLVWQARHAAPPGQDLRDSPH